MAIRSRNKREIGFSMASMSDLVFLLLIFFLITSTLVSPNAIKLLLPNSDSKTMAKQNVTVYINDQMQYFVGSNSIPITEEALESQITQSIGNIQDATIVLRADKTVPIQSVVYVIDAVNKINKTFNTKHKVILATAQKE